MTFYVTSRTVIRTDIHFRVVPRKRRKKIEKKKERKKFQPTEGAVEMDYGVNRLNVQDIILYALT